MAVGNLLEDVGSLFHDVGLPEYSVSLGERFDRGAYHPNAAPILSTYGAKVAHTAGIFVLSDRKGSARFGRRDN